MEYIPEGVQSSMAALELSIPDSRTNLSVGQERAGQRSQDPNAV